MTEFKYSAFDASGQKCHGSVAAEHANMAATALRRRGLHVFDLREQPSHKRLFVGLATTGKSAGSLNDRLLMIRQLSALCLAGIGVDRALTIMAKQAPSLRQRLLLEGLLQRVSAGTSLSAALRLSGAGMSPDEIGLLAAGEQSGTLAKALEDLSVILEKRVKLRSELLSSLTYPAVLLVLGPVSLLVISFVLVPSIAPLFEDNTAAMPLVLRAMVAVTDFLLHHTLVAALIATLILLGGTWAAKNVGWLALLLVISKRLPLVSRVSEQAEASRVCGTLASLLRGGAPLQVAIELAAAASFTTATRAQLLRARDAVQSGGRLSRALDAVSVIDSNATQMIAIGEETNRLEATLTYIAASKEQESARLTNQFMSLLTPLLTVILGVLVGGMVMSIMQAILNVNELAVR